MKKVATKAVLGVRRYLCDPDKDKILQKTLERFYSYNLNYTKYVIDFHIYKRRFLNNSN